MKEWNVLLNDAWTKEWMKEGNVLFNDAWTKEGMNEGNVLFNDAWTKKEWRKEMFYLMMHSAHFKNV